jgi:MFS family permease
MDKKRIATLFLIVLMDTAGATAIVPLIPIYVLAQFHATPFQAGLLLAAYYAAQVLAPWLGKLVLLGSLLQLVSAVGLFTVSELGAVIVFVVVFALGYGISSPTLQSLKTRFGPEQMAGRLLGEFQSVSSVAFILSMVWGTYVFDYVSPRAVFAVSAVLLALAVVGSVGIIRHKPAPEAAQSQGSLMETTADMVTIGSESGLST